MLTFGDPARPLDRRLLDSRGGFAWWYADLVDEHGDGLVLIWSWGLPFLPRLQSRARRGTPERAGDHPSLNISVYRGGAPAFYLLQRYRADDARWDPGSEQVQLGRSHFSTWAADGRHLRAEIDVDVPGSGRLSGRVTIDGPQLALPSGGSGDHHLWTPLTCAARGRADLALEGRSILSVEGRAYHDRNGSPVPLDALGIDRWLWGRVPWGDGERIWYLLWPDEGGDPTAHLLDVASDGTVQAMPVQVALSGWRAGWFGMSWFRYLELTLPSGERFAVEHRDVVDDGPFYQRFQVTAGGARGIGEWVRPHRVDRALQRPFVQMAVHEATAPNSLFLPLFTGERRGRWSRWLRNLGSGSQPPRLGTSP